MSQNAANNNMSIETISSNHSDEMNFDILSDTSVGTAHGYLNKLRSSPNKKKIRAQRPKALKNFLKSVTREQEPIKIRLNPSHYNGDNQAILVL